MNKHKEKKQLAWTTQRNNEVARWQHHDNSPELIRPESKSQRKKSQSQNKKEKTKKKDGNVRLGDHLSGDFVLVELDLLSGGGGGSSVIGHGVDVVGGFVGGR